MARKPYVVTFAEYLIGIRQPYSSLGPVEHDLLTRLAGSSKTIIEVGVFEGVTSRILCESSPPDAQIYLVDPYFRDSRVEKLLNISFTEHIAKQSVSHYKSKTHFLRQTSTQAAESLRNLTNTVDLIFIDARHEYEYVLEDFRCWSPLLSYRGIIAFDDTLNPTWGPGLLMEEIKQGTHGPWQVIEKAGQVTTVKAL